MTAARSNPVKLGLFVLAGFVTAIAAVFWLAAERLQRDTIPAVAYFAESVQGLDVGATVKIRGVTIGNVREITIAPDRQRVEVRSEIFVDRITSMGLYDPNQDFRRWLETQSALGLDVPRVQLASVGITGSKFLQVDFFNSLVNPEPALGFEVPEDYWYVPTVPSTLKSLEDGINDLMVGLPDLVVDLRRLVDRLDKSLNNIDVQSLSDRLVAVLGRIDTQLAALDAGGMSTSVRAAADSANQLLDRLGADDGAVHRIVNSWESAVTQLDQTLKGIDEVLGSIDDEVAQAGLADTTASLRETSDAYRTLAREATGLSAELLEDLAELRSTLAAFRGLAGYLERDPSALVRGRAEPATYPKESK